MPTVLLHHLFVAFQIPLTWRGQAGVRFLQSNSIKLDSGIVGAAGEGIHRVFDMSVFRIPLLTKEMGKKLLNSNKLVDLADVLFGLLPGLCLD